MLRTDVRGDRGLPFPTFRRAAAGRENASGVRGSGALREGASVSLGGGGGAPPEELEGLRGDERSFVGDSER